MRHVKHQGFIIRIGPSKRSLVLRRCKRHYPGCSCAPDDVFVCTWCERETGYCGGACDATPGLCDDCANKATALWEGLDEFAETGAQP